ncbi:MAG: hypothetical protein EP330_20340 [Deltaproteobacteria bacterium]|nr:MAG: hypothetical protein EP330_20340 [Deltaproteobacteria bacterium]
MSKPAATALVALFTAILATGCAPEVPDLECGTPEECGMAFTLDPAFLPPSADAGVAVTAAPTVDGSRLTFEVAHAACDRPEAVITLQSIGHSLPETALASLDLFATGCDATPALDAPEALTEVTVDLAELLPEQVCVGHVFVALPDPLGGGHEPARIDFDHPVCSARLAPEIAARD